MFRLCPAVLALIVRWFWEKSSRWIILIWPALSAWGEQHYYFSIFMVYVLFGILLKGMVRSSLLSKDELLKLLALMKLWQFERKALKPKLAKSWTSQFGIFLGPQKSKFVQIFTGNTSEEFLVPNIYVSKAVHQLLLNNCAEFGTAHFPAKFVPMHFGSRVWLCSLVLKYEMTP